MVVRVGLWCVAGGVVAGQLVGAAWPSARLAASAVAATSLGLAAGVSTMATGTR